MHRHGRAKVFTLASVALLSCRAVLGIEEIEEGKADGGAVDAAVETDSATPGSGVDTGADAVCSMSTGNDCGKCCRDSNKEGNGQLEQLLEPCLCDGGCGTDACKGTTLCGGATEPKDTGCIPCEDTTVKTNACASAKQECSKNAGCKAVYDCLAACK